MNQIDFHLENTVAIVVMIAQTRERKYLKILVIILKLLKLNSLLSCLLILDNAYHTKYYKNQQWKYLSHATLCRAAETSLLHR